MRCPSCQRDYADTEKVCPKDGAPLLEPLSKALRRGPMALSQVAKVLDRLLLALEPIHATGRVYGRLQPETVLLHQLGGEVTVQLLPLPEAPEPPPEYRAPELTTGGSADSAADLYAVGLLAQHLITGRATFRGPSEQEILKQQRSTRAPSLLGLALQDVPAELDALVLRLLSKNKAERPRTPSEVREVLYNLELDSTVMGERLKALSGEPGLGAAVPQIAEDHGEAATLPPSGPTIPAFGEGYSDVDPFADTLVRGLRKAEVQAAAGPVPRPKRPRVPAPGPSLDADTTLDPIDPATARGTFQTLPEPAAGGLPWAWMAAGGFLLGLSAFGVYLLFQ